MYEELRQAWSTLTAPGARFEIVETEVRGQKLREFKNAPPNLRALWAQSAGHGDNDYLVYDDERWTYADAHREVASIANWFFENGVEPGDRVAIAMRNYPEWMLCYWACTSVGIAVVGVNAWWTGPELVYGLGDSDPKVGFASRPTARSACLAWSTSTTLKADSTLPSQARMPHGPSTQIS